MRQCMRVQSLRCWRFQCPAGPAEAVLALERVPEGLQAFVGAYIPVGVHTCEAAKTRGGDPYNLQSGAKRAGESEKCAQVQLWTEQSMGHMYSRRSR